MTIVGSLILARVLSLGISLFATRRNISPGKTVAIILATIFFPLMTPLVLCTVLPLVRIVKKWSQMRSIPKDQATLEVGEINRIAQNNIDEIDKKAEKDVSLYAKKDKILNNIETKRLENIAAIEQKYGVRLTQQMREYTAPEDFKKSDSLYAERKLKLAKSAGKEPAVVLQSGLQAVQQSSQRRGIRR